MTHIESVQCPTKENGSSETFFKRCSLCGKEWRNREEFLADQSVILNGYQWNYHNVQLNTGSGGLLLFTHHHEHCGTTLALSATKFRIEEKIIKRKKNTQNAEN